MITKKLTLAAIFLLKSAYFLQGVSPEIMQLSWIKTRDWSLSSKFIRVIKNRFQSDVFVETGTLHGKTAARASFIFDSVHTVELGEKMYQAACERFKNNKNVHVYHGDSGKVLSRILSDIKGKIVFWLDAHASGGDTAMGDQYSPVIEELHAIKKNNIVDAVILIDDLRGFYEPTWPSVSETIKALLDINPRYTIIALGDTLIAYPNAKDFLVSPCIESCTISRLFDTGNFNYTLEELFAAEKIIADTSGDELAAFQKYCLFFEGHGEHGELYWLLWKALILEKNEKYAEACNLLKKIVNSSKPRKIHHWRINWYLARCAIKMGDKSLAQEMLKKVIAKQPNFKPAQDLFDIVRNDVR